MPDQTILITGAASGIGAGLAQLAARDGYTVLVTDLDGDAARQTAEAIVADGGQAHPFELDVSDPDAVRRLADALADRPVDVLVTTRVSSTWPT